MVGMVGVDLFVGWIIDVFISVVWDGCWDFVYGFKDGFGVLKVIVVKCGCFYWVVIFKLFNFLLCDCVFRVGVVRWVVIYVC